MTSTESSSDDEPFILYYIRRRRKRRAERSDRVSDFLRLRQQESGILKTLSEVRHAPSFNRYENFHRLSSDQFNDVLRRITPAIEKSNLRRDDVISADLRLSLTLRYLCSSMDMASLEYLYKVSRPSVTRIIRETCGAIWDALAPEFVQLPTAEGFERIPEDFTNLRNFPNCCGCIDGKHVVVQKFDGTGSIYYNYKHSFSVVLMGVCDAHYRFTYMSVGSAGRESDGGVFETTSFERMLVDKTLPLPGPKILPGSDISAPHVFLGDNALPSLENLICPYPGEDLHPTKILNYRHSRGRRMIENTYGVMCNRFRVHRKPIIANEETVINFVRATVALHNYLITCELELAPELRQYIRPNLVDREGPDGNVIPGSWRAEPPAESVRDIFPATQATNPEDRASDVRDMFRLYFVTEGQIPNQWKKLPAHERAFYER